MKFLLTSGGVTNDSIRSALVDLLGKPIAESHALIVPTAQWGHPMCNPISARGAVSGVAPWGGLAALGWRSLGMLELTALPTIPRKRWEEWLRAADALLVDGGDATYLAHHIRMSGLAELVPALDGVWVGISAGSLAVTPQIGDFFVNWPGAVDDGALGLVDFAIFPHLDVFPTNSLSAAHQWAEGLRCPSYVLDDASAVVIRDGLTDVVSEGVWYYLPDDEA